MRCSYRDGASAERNHGTAWHWALGSAGIGDPYLAMERLQRETDLHYEGCEVLTAAVIFWDRAPCSPCVNRRFGGTYHLQFRAENQTSKKLASLEADSRSAAQCIPAEVSLEPDTAS
jgi:hypothetical protein